MQRLGKMEKEHLFITATERLSRNLHRLFRLRSIESMARGWEQPHIASLNSWIDLQWGESFPERFPAAEIPRMKIWKHLVEHLPPPEPVRAQFPLLSLLDRTYDILTRHKIDPTEGRPSTDLVQWRREVCRAFRDALAGEGLFHPGELPVLLCTTLKESSSFLPSGISICGFEFPAPVEKDLFCVLSQIAKVEYAPFPFKEAARVSAFALPTPEEEIAFLGRNLVEDAGRIPLHRIGVIVPDLHKYTGKLETMLEDLLGETPAGDSHWFNITLGSSLSELPLFLFSLLPFRFALEGETREALVAMILSPYYGRWKGRRHVLARADRIWRSRGIRRGLEYLKKTLAETDRDLHDFIFGDPAFLLNGKYNNRKEAGGFWIDTLLEIWKALDFPVISDEGDRLAWRHLQETIKDISSYLSESRLTARDFLEWVIHAASGKTTGREAAEDAGIQIMGLIESRGLDFEKLYILDMNDRSFPRPVRPLPLLESEERFRVQGGTSESQYDFAKVAFDRIVHSTGNAVLLRAEWEESKLLTPSPFWPECATKASFNIWTDPDPAWLRAPWLASAFHGLASQESTDEVIAQGGEEPVILPAPPKYLSPSGLKTALMCPFQFLVQGILKIEPLEEISLPPAPLERGNLLHRIFAEFTEKMRRYDSEEEKWRDEAGPVLEKCVDQALAPLSASPHWKIERDRLLGSPHCAPPGLLRAWLENEMEHRSEGWRCIAEETDFSGITIDGCSLPLSGRIDRIDYHEEEGLLCLDYKTGKIPPKADILSNFTEPQLPVYLLVLGMLRLPGVKEAHGRNEKKTAACYLQIKSAKELRYNRIDRIEESLERWREIISAVASRLLLGDFTPSPYPLSPVREKERICAHCAFRTLCVRGIREKYAEEESGEGENGE